MKSCTSMRVKSVFAKKMFLLIMLLGISLFTFAQSKITGTVVDTSGQPIIGASVLVKGAKTGVITDVNGNFTITPPHEKSTLVISCVGYVTENVRADESPLKITLKEDNELLEEVVVVGYGTMKKSDLTGANTQLKNDAITATVAASPLVSLQGKAAGVSVMTNNKVGESPTIRVRGSGSITASNDPLYVVDGFPLMDGDLNDINPADIESMEILKDASSTAIYGSRGANGVIMITTKKGSKGRNNVSVNISTGVQMRSRLQNLITGQDFVNFMNEGYTRQGTQANNLPFANGYNGDFFNWEKAIIEKSSLVQDYNVSFDGGNDRTNYMLSAGYYNQDGLIEGQGYMKYSVHNNIQHKFNSWLTVGSSIQMTYSTLNERDNATGDLFRFGWPTYSAYNEDGSYNYPVIDGNNYNPIADNEASTNRTKNLRLLGNFFAEIKFNDHLSFKTQVGIDMKHSRNYQYTSSISANNHNNNIDGYGEHTWYKMYSKLMDNILTYQNQWNEHRLTVTGVYSYQDYKYEDINLYGGGFANDVTGSWNMDLADRNTVTYDTDAYSNRLISFTGRVAYALKDRYMFTATGRYDGSSRFGKNNKWGFFPSVGAAWRVTEEEFLAGNRVLTDLKIRASWGITGNQEIGNYKSLSQLISDKNYNYNNGTADGIITGYYETIGNPDLKWERTTQFDVGFDLSLWNRLNITFDYYTRNTNDLLYEVPIPTTSGYTSILDNVGKVRNKGFELTVGGDIVKTQDFKLTASVNFTHNENEIKELYGDVTSITVRDGSTGLGQILRVGYPVNSVWARHSMGIIKDEAQLAEYTKRVTGVAGAVGVGSEMYEDVDNSGSINIDDYKCLGSVEPKLYYGINLGAEYKKFKLNIYGQGASKYASMTGSEDSSVNGTAWAIGYSNIGSYLLYGENQLLNNVHIPTTYAYKRMWSESNPNGSFPAAGAKGVFLSDRTNGDWRYFILKNIQLSYDFSDLIKINTVRSLVFNVNFQNFVTFANHRGYNPENGDVSNPWAKSIIFSINAKF